MASNTAAWLTHEGERPFKIAPSELPKPGEGELVVKNHAIAINPVDWKMQYEGMLVGGYPIIPGCDVSGEVYSVGSGVTAFKPGDRVTAHGIALARDNKPEYGAYQNYTLTDAGVTSLIPDNVSYTAASVLPLALSTAASGLYPADQLALPYPSVSPSATNKILLVWGGSSSVGSTTIQLAKASGLEVISTASAKNISYVKSQAGADHVFDHRSESVADDIIATIKKSGKDFAGVYDAISLPDSYKHVAKVFNGVGGSDKRLATTLPPGEDLPKDVTAKWVFAGTLSRQHRDVAEAVWGKFVPEALRQGKLKLLPEAQVAGKGLEALQKGADLNKEGVSAKKIVVEL